ncbi:hypothetical protein KBB25_01755 [Candidatus Gracilibacteria bacterium]|nr:hypothetical protein [Candidatus Gracilibacteria bacterium]
MEAIDKRRENRLIKGIVFSTLIFIGCIIYGTTFLLPKYNELGVVTNKANTIITDISALEKNGVNKDSFVELLTRLGKKKEVPDVVFTDSKKLTKALSKPTKIQKNYLEWLVEENGKVSLLDQEIRENDKILGNIIPVFVDSATINSEDDTENQITLASFISYIEKDILAKYSLSSYAPIGIGNVSFPDKKDVSINIGSFKITIDFQGKNSNILSFIDALQKSGNLTIENGKLVPDPEKDIHETKGKGLSSLSNLLVNIQSLSLSSIPTIPNLDNNGSVVLEFYVEGMNYQKMLILRSLLMMKFEGLEKSIKEKGGLCAKTGNSLCNEATTANAITSIKGLLKNISALRPKIEAIKKGNSSTDTNKDIDTLFDIKASLSTIEMIYLKNNSLLEKAKK